MEYIILGRTGIEVSVVGLGAGGPSKIGKSSGKSESESIALVKRAFDLGITFFDTAESYDTEGYVGKALAGVPVEKVCISTKLSCHKNGKLKNAGEVEASLDASLKQLRRETVDIYHMHGVEPQEYGEVFDKIYPVLERMREKGKIRFTGITEMFSRDPDHKMLARAVEDDVWDVIMVGFNVLNFSARPLLERTRAQGIGVLDMFAVRRALRDPVTIKERLAKYVADGSISPDTLTGERPFEWAIDSGECRTIPELAYRFCRHEPGIDVVLSGTGSVEHLRNNIAVMEKPPLSVGLIRRIEAVFSGANTISGD